MKSPMTRPRAPRPRKPKAAWRDYLTDDERAVIEAGDAAMKAARDANRDRPRIVNRAIQRAKYYAARSKR